MIPLHPRACPGDPSRLRWIAPPGTIPFVGAVAGVPAVLAALLDDATLTEIRLDATGVTTRLGPGRSWAESGPKVRTALHAALEQPDRWSAADSGSAGLAGCQDAAGQPGRPDAAGLAGRPDAAGFGTGDGPSRTPSSSLSSTPSPTCSSPGAAADPDGRLEATVRRLLTGPVGHVAAAHGGGIELVDVHDGVVRLRLEGACHGCPAAGLTVGGRLEAELRKEPGFRAITTAERPRTGPRLTRLRSWWRLPLTPR